jgi:ubiquinone/menaquinone biosynthesis C-methylase UbiE
MNKVFCSKFRGYIKSNIIGTQYEWESHIDNMLQLFDKNLKKYMPNNIIDIGCGDGSRTMRIAKHFDIDLSRVYGIDSNDNHIKTCQNNFNAYKLDLEFEAIPHDDDIFDLVICNQVLEHLKNYNKVIDELIRVTRKMGYIAIGIPNLAHLINRIYLMFGFQPMCIHLDGSHVRSFAHKSFVKMLASLSRVQLVDCCGSLMYPLPFFLAKSFSHRFVGLSGYVCYLLQKI